MSATAFTRYIEHHHVSNMERFAYSLKHILLARLIPKPWCPSLFSFSDHSPNDLEQYLVLFNLIPRLLPS